MPVTMPVFDGSGIDLVTTGESWHANLLRFDRRKCVLFTHDASLYSVFMPRCLCGRGLKISQAFCFWKWKVLAGHALRHGIKH